MNSVPTRTTILFFMCLFLWPDLSQTTETETEKNKADNAPIQILSDRLEVDSETNVADFIGNVQATQGNSVIHSNQLKIFYKDNLMKKDKASSTEQSIQKIIAIGKVRINFDNRVAVADQAVYTADQRTLVLTGRNAKVTTDNNTVAGEKIIIHRDSGQMTVAMTEGSDGQVEVFVSGQEGGFQ